MNSEKLFKLVWVLFAVLFVCIIINIVLIFLFTGNSNNAASNKELKDANAKIEMLQRQVADLGQQVVSGGEEGGKGIAYELLEGRVSILEKTGVGSDAGIDQRLKQLEMKVSTLEIAFKQANGISAANANTGSSTTTTTTTTKPSTTTTTTTATSNQQSNTGNRTPIQIQTGPSGTASANAKYHTVQPGENLFRISQKYNLTVEQLRRMNNMKENDVLKAGQRLIVSQ